MPLWVVATPLGTLSDFSERARTTLTSASVVACEDTRTTRKLLTALELPAPELVALHAHNEERRADALASRALEEDVVLVSDAGTPAVSDPGRVVVERCHALGVQVLSVPGPSALSTALSVSGLNVSPSTFLGFPPRKGRAGWARQALGRAETLVIYEAPTRIASLVEVLAALAPEREGVLCRELSKRYEQVLRAPLGELGAQLPDPLKGECVLVVGPGTPLVEASATLEAGASLKEIAAVLAERWGIKKRDAYQRLLSLEQELAAAGD